jgi:hypothetical protein
MLCVQFVFPVVFRLDLISCFVWRSTVLHGCGSCVTDCFFFASSQPRDCVHASVFLIDSHSSSLWSPSPVFQLVSEPVWSLIGFNRLCDSKATWRKVLSSL